jgi:hypothetical protein
MSERNNKIETLGKGDNEDKQTGYAPDRGVVTAVTYPNDAI